MKIKKAVSAVLAAAALTAALSFAVSAAVVYPPYVPVPPTVVPGYTYPVSPYPVTPYPGYPSRVYPVTPVRPPYWPAYIPYPLPIIYPVQPVQPSQPVDEEEPEPPKWENPFKDIPYDADYLEALEFVITRGLFTGISSTEFAPDATMTRAMYVTVLGRMTGLNMSKYKTSSFYDVPEGSWYAPYVEWAVENGIVFGYQDGGFHPDMNITIEQAITILARFAGYKNEYNDYSNFMSRYFDTDEIDEWAIPYMGWASAYLLYNGSRGYLRPQKDAVRSEIAVLLWNFAK